MASFNPDGSIQTSDGRTIFADDPVTVGEFAELSKLLVPQKNGLWPFAHGGGGAGGFVASGGGGGGPATPVGNGAQGAQGPSGADGAQGPQGPGLGAQGAQGPSGAQGSAGAQGSQGSQGTGAQGAQGAGGPQGTAGAQGSQGTIGAQGAQGSGAQGAQGSSGAQGSQGTAGAQGSQGAQGPGLTTDIFASDRVVDPAGAGTDTTLAAALAALPASGGTIYVKAGTYNIAATMVLPDKDVTIIGAGSNAISGSTNATVFDLGANAIFLFDTGSAAVFNSYKFRGFEVVGTSTAGQGFLNMPVGALGSSVICEQLTIGNVIDIVKTNGQDSDVTFRDCSLAPATATGSFWHGAGPGGELNWDHVQASLFVNGSTNAITGGPSWNVAYSYIGGGSGPSTFVVKDINWVVFFLGKDNDKATVTVNSAISTIVSCQFIGVSLIINTTLFFCSNSWFSGSSLGNNAQVVLNGDDVTLTGVNFDASGAASSIGVDCVDVDNIEISGCQFEGHGTAGIRASGTSTLSATGCRFSETVPVQETVNTVSGKYAANQGFTGSILLGPTSSVDGRSVRTVTGNTTLDDDYETVNVDATGGNVTILLPLAASIPFKRYNIKKIDATANTVTIDGNGAETIDGALTQVISTQYASLSPESDNVNAWWIV